MKKETLQIIILGTVGGLFFALGMCMSLISEWGLFYPGIVLCGIGLVTLLPIIPIYRKTHPKKEKKPLDKNVAASVIAGIFGTALLGVGMALSLTVETASLLMVSGIIFGIVGLLICVLNYPVFRYLRDAKKEQQARA